MFEKVSKEFFFSRLKYGKGGYKTAVELYPQNQFYENSAIHAFSERYPTIQGGTLVTHDELGRTQHVTYLWKMYAKDL